MVWNSGKLNPRANGHPASQTRAAANGGWPSALWPGPGVRMVGARLEAQQAVWPWANNLPAWSLSFLHCTREKKVLPLGIVGNYVSNWWNNVHGTLSIASGLEWYSINISLCHYSFNSYPYSKSRIKCFYQTTLKHRVPTWALRNLSFRELFKTVALKLECASKYLSLLEQTAGPYPQAFQHWRSRARPDNLHF